MCVSVSLGVCLSVGVCLCVSQSVSVLCSVPLAVCVSLCVTVNVFHGKTERREHKREVSVCKSVVRVCVVCVCVSLWESLSLSCVLTMCLCDWFLSCCLSLSLLVCLFLILLCLSIVVGLCNFCECCWRVYFHVCVRSYPCVSESVWHMGLHPVALSRPVHRVLSTYFLFCSAFTFGHEIWGKGGNFLPCFRVFAPLNKWG